MASGLPAAIRSSPLPLQQQYSVVGRATSQAGCLRSRQFCPLISFCRYETMIVLRPTMADEERDQVRRRWRGSGSAVRGRAVRRLLQIWVL